MLQNWAGIRTSEVARSKGSSKSAMSGSVLKKCVHRCRKPNVKPRSLPGAETQRIPPAL